MVHLGYTLSSEEFRPMKLVDQAVAAERAGFTYAGISDHFHPWMDSQGHSPFVWSTLGGIAARTTDLTVMTGVTAPIIRIHPAIIAQAAATVGDMMPGRFVLGLGTGEALNEHILGDVWPPISIRQEMLGEAIEIIRELWLGEYVTVESEFYTVHNARLYTVPDQLPPIYVAASGPETATIASDVADGIVSTAPAKDVVEAFTQVGAQGRPIVGQLTICYGDDEDACAQTALDIWGYSALGGQMSQELALPKYFQESAKKLVTPDTIKEEIVCGPDVDKIRDAIKEYEDAGFTHVYIHQIGPDQQRFIDMAQKDLLPNMS